MNYVRGMYVNSRVLSEAYKRQRNIDSAYKYQNLMLGARDSLFNQDKINQIQITVIEEQQRVQKLEEEKVKLENRTKIYVSLGTMVVLLAFVLFFYRNQRKTQKANVLLQHQRDEIHQQRTQLQQSLETLKATQAQLIQKEKLASLGELTAGIAHEIQNPLNFVNNFSELSVELAKELKEERLKAKRDEELENELLDDLIQNQEKITYHGGRASSIVNGMLEHSRATTGERQPTDLNQLADEYLRLSYHGLRAKDSNFHSDYELIVDNNLPFINVVPQEIGRVLLNLINNAFYAVNERSKLKEPDYHPKVTVRTYYSPFGDWGASVQDNGNGIPAAIKDKIFQPFFTTKPTGEGTGLGLSLSYDIVTKGHSGTIEVETKESEGTTFIIRLPL
ncbi:histidine kinase [Runella sp. CRIBMP]|nr:histidine kinase [Runella sp. CRIBMP]